VGALTVLLTTTAVAAPTIGPRPTAAPPGLQHGRVYEQVSPVEKNGNPINGAMAARAAGGGIAYRSTGSIAGAQSNFGSVYLKSERGAAGWKTTALMPRIDGRTPETADEPAFVGIASDFSRSLLLGSYPYDRADRGQRFPALGTPDLYRTESDGSTTWVSRGPGAANESPAPAFFVAASDDASRTVVQTERSLTPDVPEGSGQQLYAQVDGQHRLLSVAPGPDGGPLPGGAVAGRQAVGGLTVPSTHKDGDFPNAVSDDGQTVVFASVQDARIYVRRNALREDADTVEATASQVTGAAGQFCSFGHYLGGSADGAKVLFWCADNLTDDATAPSIYSYDVETEQLAVLPGTASSFLPELFAADDDLEHVYFLAGEQLTPDAPAAVGPVANIYDVHGGEIRYVGQYTGGVQIDVTRAPAVSGDGSVLLFKSAEAMDPGYDNGGRFQMYVYDADDGPDGTRTCISCRSDGLPAQADAGFGTSDANTLGASEAGEFGLLNIRRPDDSMTADGARVFFTSADRVVPEATNGKENVYEYADGRVSLLSTGKASGPSIFAGVSKDGADAFLITPESLTKGDSDGGETDMYVARVGGGLPDPPAPPARCSGDACRGPATADEQAAVTPAPAGSTAVGRGNVTQPPVRSTPRTVQLMSLTKATRSKLAAGRLASLELRTRGRGTVSVRLRARIGSRTVTVGTAKRTVRTENVSKKRLKVRLSDRGVAQLRRSSRLRVQVEVRMSGVSRPATRTVTLTRTTSTKKGSR
jgi:hypothetical protein